MRATVTALAHDSMLGRFAGSPQSLIAARYIATRFAMAGLRPLFNRSFLWRFDGTGGLRTHNVLAVLPGRSRPDEWILFSAHYDHIGTEANAHAVGAGRAYSRGDKIFNGANDNASGVAGLIALAEQAASDTASRERTLVFAAFSGEELGLQGSYALADTMDVRKLVAQINLEMLGRPIAKSGNRPFITGDHASTLRSILNAWLARTDSSFGEYFLEDPFGQENLFYRSDNFPFHRKGLAAAHTLSATNPQDVFYHSVDDEVETLNFSTMSDLLQNLYRACGSLIDGTATPTKPVKRSKHRR